MEQIKRYNHLTTELTTENIEAAFKNSAKRKWNEEDIKWVKDSIQYDMDSIIFLQNLSSPNRKTLAEAPKDEEGNVIVDISNPHILENMDWFKQAALNHEKYKRYTNKRKDPHPLSSYSKFWKEEREKCLSEKVVRPDGEWIPGKLYWYWNYAPIMKTVAIKGKKKVGDRVAMFPDVWEGDYLWYHYKHQAFYGGGADNYPGGSHAVNLKCRGMGYSNKAGSEFGRNFCIGSTTENFKKVKSYALAGEGEYLTKDGLLDKFVDNREWVSKETEFPSVCTLKNSMSDMHWILGRKVKRKVKGLLNEVIGVTLKNDTSKARGKRGVDIFWEEIGKLRGFLSAWVIAQPSVEDGDITFGQMTAWGTGGEVGENFYGAKIIYYDPSSYNAYGVPNVYDRKSSGEKRVGFFHAAYLNRIGCYDENGNSDVIKALLEIYIGRWHKRNSADPNALIQEKAERPVTPQEAMMRREGSIFPIADLKSYVENEIAIKEHEFVAPHYVADLVFENGEVSLSLTDKHPIRKYPTPGEANKEGAVEIFQVPKEMANGKIPWGRYIAGIDPYDDDTGTSLGSIFVFDLLTDTIVAEYTGRPKTAEQFYEICRRLLIYYNAQANYEQNKKGLFAYFSNKNSLHLLCDTPQILRDNELIKHSNQGNKSKGTTATQAVNSWGVKLQASWQITPRKGRPEDMLDENQEEVKEERMLNLHTIRSLGYLDECIGFNADDNFDRVSAMNMVMILREDRIKLKDSIEGNATEANPMMEDEFFNMYDGPKIDPFVQEQINKFYKNKKSVNLDSSFEVDF